MACVFCKRAVEEYVHLYGNLLKAMKTKLRTLTSEHRVCRRCQAKAQVMLDRLILRKQKRAAENNMTSSSSSVPDSFRSNSFPESVSLEQNRNVTVRRRPIQARQSSFSTPPYIRDVSSEDEPIANEEIIVVDGPDDDDQMAINPNVPGSQNMRNTQPLIRTRRTPVFGNDHLVPIYQAKTTGG